jgi:CheY-like chemotaxis protein
VSQHILIVEDAETCMDTLEIALSSLNGHTVSTAASAEEALSFLARHGVVAVVTDLNLPGMSGFELMRQIRKTGGAAQPAIIVISGDTDPQAPQRAIEAGANAFFAKPYSPAEVRRTLERLIHGT